MIQTVHIENFLIHRNRKFSLAPSVTLITGENGRGKTTLIQALVWAIWGQKLRPLGDAASVRLETSAGPLWRRTGHSELVDFAGVRSSNKTKAIANIESRFGAYASWHRSLYITGKTVSSFSSATPKGRWDHLMRLLGAEIFDRALSRVTERRRSVSQTLNQKRYAANVAEAALASAERKLELSAGDFEIVHGGPNTDSIRALIDNKDMQMASLEVRAAAHTKAKKAFLESGERRAADAAILSARQVIDALPETTCFVCGQRVPNPDYSAAQESLTAARAVLSSIQERQREFEDTSSMLSSEYRVLRSEKEKLEAELRESLAVERSYINVEKAHLSLLTDYVNATRTLYDAQAACTEITTAQRIVETAYSILVESKKVYIAAFCSDIERLANEYLLAIGAPHRVSLVLLDGALNIQTTGTGADSYESCSSGEQRRIDICLLLAMSQVASSTGNLTQAAPLVIDEALDTLDETGVEALLLLACDIAKHRQVILVSHAMPPLPQGTSISHLDLNTL